MEKTDYKKTNRSWYRPSSKQAEIVEIPPIRFLMIDGENHPDHSATYKDAVEALFGLSYTLKFLFKKHAVKPEGYHDYVVLPLEGLWWLHSGDPHFDLQRYEDWRWTIMVRQPDFFTGAMVEAARGQLATKKDLPELKNIRFETFHEGKSIQMLHIGPFSEEKRTLDVMYRMAEEQGLRFRGKHHEIYLSDFRRTVPEKFKTVLRHPVM